MLKITPYYEENLVAGTANTYIVTDSATGDSAIIDPGLPFGKAHDAAVALGDKLKYILLTHRHFDHVLGVAALKRESGAAAAIHSLDAKGLSSSRESLYDMFSRFYDFPFEASEADILLDEGSVIELGESRLDVLHTAGHTAGGVCYLCGGDIFTGDTLFRDSMGRIDFPSGSAAEMAASLHRLAALDPTLKAWPGHGMPTTIGREKSVNYYMKQAENGTIYD